MLNIQAQRAANGEFRLAGKNGEEWFPTEAGAEAAAARLAEAGISAKAASRGGRNVVVVLDMSHPGVERMASPYDLGWTPAQPHSDEQKAVARMRGQDSDGNYL